MPLIVTSRRRIAQPQGPVAITDRFGRPVFCFLPTHRRGVDLAGNVPGYTDTADRVATPYGVGATFGTGKSILYDATNVAGGPSAERTATYVYVLKYGTASAWQWVTTNADSDGYSAAARFGHGWSIGDLGFSSTATILTPADGGYYVVVVRANLWGATSDAWVNGVKTATWTNSDGKSYNNQYIGRRWNSDSEHFTGALLGKYVLLGLRSEAEVVEICRNPWQVFALIPRRIWVPGAGSLPTLSAATYMPGSLTSVGFRPRVTAS